MSSKRTDKVELVETHNIALSLKRLQTSSDEYRWRRAFYHALGMNYCASQDMKRKIREALELP